MIQICPEPTDLLSRHLPGSAELFHPSAQVSNLAIPLLQGLSGSSNSLEMSTSFWSGSQS